MRYLNLVEAVLLAGMFVCLAVIAWALSPPFFLAGLTLSAVSVGIHALSTPPRPVRVTRRR